MKSREGKPILYPNDQKKLFYRYFPNFMIALDNNSVWKLHKAELKVLYCINMGFMNDKWQTICVLLNCVKRLCKHCFIGKAMRHKPL